MLSVFLIIHADALAGSLHHSDDEAEEDIRLANGLLDDENELEVALQEMLASQETETREVGGLVRTSLGLVAWARGVPVV